MLDPSAKLFQHCWNHSLAKMAVEFKFTKSYEPYPSHNAMIIVACARLSVCEDERKDEKRASERKTAGRVKGRACKHLLKTLIRPLPRPPRVNMSNVKMCKEEFARVRRLNFFLFYFLIYQLFWTQACSAGLDKNGTHRSHATCHLYPIPQPVKVGHTTGVYVTYSFRTVVWPTPLGSFTSHKNRSVKVLWAGTYGFSSLPEKTRKSNHLQMPLQRQHFLLSYLKTLGVGPASVWTRNLPLDRPAFSRLS